MSDRRRWLPWLALLLVACSILNAVLAMIGSSLDPLNWWTSGMSAASAVWTFGIWVTSR